MRIGVDIRSLMTPYRTGVGEYTYELLNALFSFDRENEYFLFYNSYTDVSQYIPQWQYDNVHYVFTKWPNKIFNASQQLFKKPELDRLIIQQCNNVTIQQLDYFFSPNLNFTSLSPHTKHILTIHDLSFEFFPDCFSWKQRAWHRLINPKKQCERADIILTPSENTRRDVIEKYSITEEKVKVVYPGLGGPFKEQGTRLIGGQAVINNEIEKKYNLPENFILFLGTIEPRKNIESIIEAFKSSELPASPAGGRTPNYELVIAGSRGWKCNEIFRLIEETPGVRYIGYVAEEDKPALYQLAQLLVYPSLYEGFGFPVLEAMASGIPVITSNRSSLVEVAGGAGFLVNPSNIDEITEGMRLLTSHETLRATLIARGRKQAEKFSWERSAQELVRLFTNPSKQ